AIFGLRLNHPLLHPGERYAVDAEPRSLLALGPVRSAVYPSVAHFLAVDDPLRHFVGNIPCALTAKALHQDKAAGGHVKAAFAAFAFAAWTNHCRLLCSAIAASSEATSSACLPRLRNSSFSRWFSQHRMTRW